MSVKVLNLSFNYGHKKVLDNLSFELKENCLLNVLGPNGIGKSTMFKCMLGLLPKYNGEIHFNGKNMKTFSIKELAKNVAYIPQSHSPAFNFSVMEMVLMGTTSQISTISNPGKKQIEIAEKAIEMIGIGKLVNCGYTKISGGEQQLVLIARALAQQAKILIMDEPTANLDYGNQMKVLHTVKTLVNCGYTIIQSTHNPDQTFLYADRVLALWGGKILTEGTPQEMITSGLIKKLYEVDVEVPSLYDDKVRVCIPKSIINA